MRWHDAVEGARRARRGAVPARAVSSPGKGGDRGGIEAVRARRKARAAGRRERGRQRERSSNWRLATGPSREHLSGKRPAPPLPSLTTRSGLRGRLPPAAAVAAQAAGARAAAD